MDGFWPDGKQFAFTIFDDTDCATLENVRPVYAFLASQGLRTTKSAWVIDGDPSQGKNAGDTCARPEYREWLQELQSQGFEIAFHGATWHGVPREAMSAALDKFAGYFGHDPAAHANHSGAFDGIYWTDARLTGVRRVLYNLLTRFQNRGVYQGHVETSPFFWGDICQRRIKYVRNFTFRDINTLAACPVMPYRDPLKPYVNGWFAGSDGHDIATFNRCISEENQDRLERQGGACILYSHFGKDCVADGAVNRRFQELIARLAKKDGWFAPVTEVLDYLAAKNGLRDISAIDRRRLEWKWFREKLLLGRT